VNRIVKLIDSSVGQKFVAGASGLALTLFLIVHMAGNLQIFAGSDALNQYAKMLKSQTLVLWGARLGLLGLIVLHIGMTVRQVIRNRSQRHRDYTKRKYQKTTRASRYMMLSGTLILIFLVFHLLHFTGGLILPSAYEQLDSQGRHDVYAMVVDGFHDPMIVMFYTVGMISLVGHLKHAISSSLQTLGILKNGYDSKLRMVANWSAWVIVVGFLVVPLTIYMGLIGG